MAKVAELGYKTVESANFFNRTLGKFNEILKNTGIKLSSTLFHRTSIRDKYDETLTFHKAVGIDVKVESEGQEPDGISERTCCIEYLKMHEK